ncbi:MAG: DUF1576 domain-containing protein [Oscillospiraceae bacterium]|nr:DUF1576 domain-containing protein [Oscillospiraceae bacterium]
MNKIKNLSESSFLKLFFGFLSACFILAAVCMPDRGQMFSGLWQIISNPQKISTNDFAVGGYAATFLNMGLVGACFLALFVLLKANANNVSTFGFILTVGFSSWGINILNIWPTILGVVIYCLVKKEKLSANVNAMMFSTGIAPLISDLLVRYPNAEVVGFNLPGLLVTLIVGIFIGFMLPAGLGHAPAVHKGFDLYSAAVPVCFFAFFLNATLYKTIGIALPAAPAAETLQVASQSIVNIFCIVVFGLCIVFALAMGCKVKDYWKLLTADDHVVSITGKMGKEVFLMNVGVFGLFILAYYNLIGASFNGVTFGIIFCMLCTCNSGSHPGNVWPIMLGYVIASYVFGWLSGLAGGTFATAINAQAICVGLCFANGLSPVASKYGWVWGAVAAMMHYLLVTSVPNMHGGYCLYNGGFTAAVICVILVPVLERFCKTKLERKALKAEK